MSGPEFRKMAFGLCIKKTNLSSGNVNAISLSFMMRLSLFLLDLPESNPLSSLNLPISHLTIFRVSEFVVAIIFQNETLQ